MRQPTLAVIGSAVTDIVVETPRLPGSGENIHVPRLAVMPGGKATNAAVTLVRLGAAVHLISNTGRDHWGEQLRQELAAAGIQTSLIGRHPSQPTGIVIMLAEASGQTAYIAHPAAGRSVSAADIRQRLTPLLPRLDGLLFNLEADEAALQTAADLAYAAGVPIFVDAGPVRPYAAGLWQHAAILSPNEPEAAALVGHNLADEAAVVAAAQALLAAGPPVVVLKLGARGAYWATPTAAGWAPAFPIQVIDPAGAGDAFTAGLVWASLTGQPLPQAVRWANACGAIVAGRFGTMPAMPQAEEVRQFLASYPA